MDRKRAVLAASSVLALLVVGSAAIAVGSGAFTAHPVDRVGSFQSIRAGLISRAEPTSTSPSTSTGASSPGSQTVRPTRAVATSVPVVPRATGHFTVPTAEPRVVASSASGVSSIAPRTSVPEVERTAGTSREHDAHDNEPAGRRRVDD